MKVDLHMHSRYSDGRAGIEEIAKKAGFRKLEVIGISDHIGKEIVEINMDLRLFNSYIRDIDSANNYGLTTLRGIEISRIENLRLLEEEQINQLDYLLFEYAEQNTSALNSIATKLKKPVGLAHPKFSEIDWRNVGEVFVEFNPRYMFEDGDEEETFWGNFQGNWISVGSDAHDLKDIEDDEVKRVRGIIRKYGLKQVYKREDFQEIIRIREST